MTKVFRIPHDDPILWQLNCSERTIDQLLNGFFRMEEHANASNRRKGEVSTLEVRPPTPPDGSGVCPICFDAVHEGKVIWCFSCGQYLHYSCFNMFAAHNRTHKTTCPLCRDEWTNQTIAAMRQNAREMVKPQRELPIEHRVPFHKGCYCSQCRGYVRGWVYKTCDDDPTLGLSSDILCLKHYMDNQLPERAFVCRRKPDEEWIEAPLRISKKIKNNPVLMNEVRELQYRDLTPEDYNLLLTLDEEPESLLTETAKIIKVIPQITDECVCYGCHDEVCGERPAIVLSCGCIYHRECIVSELGEKCPYCARRLLLHAAQPKKRRKSARKAVSNAENEVNTLLSFDGLKGSKLVIGTPSTPLKQIVSEAAASRTVQHIESVTETSAEASVEPESSHELDLSVGSMSQAQRINERRIRNITQSLPRVRQPRRRTNVAVELDFNVSGMSLQTKRR
ncbi:hypothetical protein PCE1_003891 [Barthelona sp. PCE]